MTFKEYLNWVAEKIENENDKEEAIRLLILIKDTCDDNIRKLREPQ